MSAILLPPDIWTDLNQATGIAVGSEVAVQNVGTTDILLYESDTIPDFSSRDGVVLSTVKDYYSLGIAEAGSERIWGKPVDNLSAKLIPYEVKTPVPPVPTRNYYEFNSGGVGAEYCSIATTWTCFGAFSCTFNWLVDGGVATGQHTFFSDNAGFLLETSVTLDFDEKDGGTRDGVIYLTISGTSTELDIPLGFDWSVEHKWVIYRDTNSRGGISIDGTIIAAPSWDATPIEVDRFFSRYDGTLEPYYLKGRVWDLIFQVEDPFGTDYYYQWDIDEGSGSTLTTVSASSSNTLTIENFDNNWISA